jgi:mannitol-1-phosphate/altronate dehydrogenase
MAKRATPAGTGTAKRKAAAAKPRTKATARKPARAAGAERRKTSDRRKSDRRTSDLAKYKRTLLQRFANPAIADQLYRLCRRGSTKMPHHLLPSLREALAADRPHALLTLAVAGWFQYLRRVDPTGRPVPVDDPRAEELQALALTGGTDPRPLLDDRSIFGDLGEHPRFVAELADALERLDRDGVRVAVATALYASERFRP